MPRADPYAGYRFLVLIDHVEKGGFTKVRSLARETRVETFREGGVNDREHKLASLTTYGNFVLERGLADADLWEWHQDVVEGRVKRRTLTVSLRDEKGRDTWGWIIQGAFPVKWAVADFDANSGQVVAETIEFAYHGFLKRGGGAGAG